MFLIKKPPIMEAFIMEKESQVSILLSGFDTSIDAMSINKSLLLFRRPDFQEIMLQGRVKLNQSYTLRQVKTIILPNNLNAFRRS